MEIDEDKGVFVAMRYGDKEDFIILGVFQSGLDAADCIMKHARAEFERDFSDDDVEDFQAWFNDNFGIENLDIDKVGGIRK